MSRAHALCAATALSSLVLSPAFAQSVVTVPAVTVESEPASGSGGKGGPGIAKTTAGPVQGYRALTAGSATKTNTPIEKIPQSIQVVPRSVLDDQTALSPGEAIRNVSATVGVNPLQTPAYETTHIRGFPAEQWLDGLTTYYNAGGRDSLANIERIEVLKGPSAILYGGGVGAPLGGVVNVVSKLPQDRAFGEVGVTFGSFGLVQPYFDFNQPLNKQGTILFRMTGEYAKSNSFINTLDLDRYDINPTLTFTNKSDTTLTIQGRLSDWKQQEYQGLPAVGTITGGFAIDRGLFVGPTDIPRSYSRVASVTAKLDHTFNNVWSASAQARFGVTEFKESTQLFVGTDFTGNAPAFPPSSWGLLNIVLAQKQQEAAVNANALAHVVIGPTDNKFLFGGDYARVTDKGYMIGDLAAGFGLGFVDLAAPGAFPAFVEPANTPLNTFSDGDNTYITSGLFAQAQSDIYERVHLLGGLRLANVNINSVSPAFGATNVTDATKLLPRIGAVVDVIPGFSVFADYSEGLKANPFVLYLGTPKPEESKQAEAGIKFSPGFGLSGSAAVFQIDRSGVPVAAPGGFLSIAGGRERSRGFEADLIWQPTENWQFLANYAHVEPRLLNAIGGGLPGNSLNFIPADSGRFWANYRFDGAWRGWSAGAGVYAASGAYVDIANLYKTSGYATMDAKIAFENEHLKASIDAKNLTGTRYFTPYEYLGGRVAPGAPRALYGQVAVKF